MCLLRKLIVWLWLCLIISLVLHILLRSVPVLHRVLPRQPSDQLLRGLQITLIPILPYANRPGTFSTPIGLFLKLLHPFLQKLQVAEPQIPNPLDPLLFLIYPKVYDNLFVLVPIDDLIDLDEWDYHFGVFGDVVFCEGEVEIGLAKVRDEVALEHEK